MTDQTKNKRGSIVHFILSQSYIVFFYALIVGVFLHMYFKTPLFQKQLSPTLGILLVISGSMLILWAQNTSSKSKKKMLEQNVTREFARGPYKWTRKPTHTGIFFMIFGFVIVTNSLYILLTLMVALLVTKYLFIRKEEKYLEQIYGDMYRDYKKKVRTWI